MLAWLARLLEVSSAVAATLLGVIVVQVATQVYALVDLAKRRAVRGDRKWVWALVIALGNLPGAVAYLAAGRTSAKIDVPAASGANAAGDGAVRRAVDTLYGPRNRE
jgi:hypothetical protein